MKKALFSVMTVLFLAQGAMASDDVDAQDFQNEEDAAAASILPFPPPPFPGPVPTPGFSFTCYAQNRRGQMFPAVGFDQIMTQSLAVQYCERNSLLRCTPIGCNMNGGGF